VSETSPRIEAIFVARGGGEAMERVEEMSALAGRGLEADRYLLGTGYWSGVDECQVTLIEAEGLDEIETTSGVRVTNGEHRRNLVTRGVRLQALVGRRFRVGEVLLEYDRPRPPCRYIQSVSERGMTRALGRDRGGICARVVEGGIIRVGDGLDLSARQGLR
jgi:MOSC domain-containing protein YiiM